MRRALPLLLIALALASCTDDEKGTAAGCDKAMAQMIDPLSSQHLLPGAAEPKYNTEPPTSGAHRLGDFPTGVVKQPIDNATQVGMLEAGLVLVQYKNSSTADRRALAEFAQANPRLVTIAPNDKLPSPVVATAWLYMLRCDGVDKTALQEFVDDHAREEQAH